MTSWDREARTASEKPLPAESCPICGRRYIPVRGLSRMCWLCFQNQNGSL